MSTPDLFVIGAQKCGTTTLYEDLAHHPDVALGEKESSPLLCSHDPLEVLTMYGRTGRGTGSVFVDVSTEYAMRPLHDVADVAAAVAGDAHVVYIVRDPVARVISHHHHEVAARKMTSGIDDAVQRHGRLIDYSRYAYQLRPWMEAFGRENVHVLRFETYMASRNEGVRSLHSILGVAPRDLQDPNTAHNAADNKRVAVGPAGKLASSRLYRDLIRPRIPGTVKESAKRVLLPKAPPRPSPPSRATVELLVRTLTPEVEALAELMDRDLMWDLQERWLK